MTKSISRSQVRLITSTNAIFGADEACAMLRISRDAMYRLAKDPDDPFPIRFSHASRLEFCPKPMPPSDARNSLGPRSRPPTMSSDTLSRMIPLRI